jgi:3-hydroxyacyl-CoA dehydrogenase
MYTLVNQGAMVLEERVAQRASDIDVIWVNGYGWPAYRGGPMYWADQVGLSAIVDGLKGHASRLGASWELAPGLQRRATDGSHFTR